MAAEMIETLVGQFRKLRKDVAAKKPSKVIANASTHHKKEGELVVKTTKDQGLSIKEEDVTACTLSESTMCLLLDRFVPC